MGLLDQVMLDDAVNCSSHDIIGAEAIIYTPRGGGTPRTIYAVIDRNPPAIVEGTNTVRKPKFTISGIPNHATLGILAGDTAMIGGTLTFAAKIGRAAEPIVIPSPNPAKQDPGAITIEI